jgi:VanZ family protein
VRFFWLALLVGYCSFIFYLSHQPSLPVPALFQHQDKFFHAGAYGLMALLAISFFKYQLNRFSVALTVAFIFCALYGVTDEWHQSFVEGRQADVLDWLADCFGALLALWFYNKAKRYLVAF